MLNKVPVTIPPEVYRSLEEYVHSHEPAPSFGPEPSLGQVLASAHSSWLRHRAHADGPPQASDLEPFPIPEGLGDE